MEEMNQLEMFMAELGHKKKSEVSDEKEAEGGSTYSAEVKIEEDEAEWCWGKVGMYQGIGGDFEEDEVAGHLDGWEWAESAGDADVNCRGGCRMSHWWAIS